MLSACNTRKEVVDLSFTSMSFKTILYMFSHEGYV
jgi:hypothetical protein